MKNGIDATHKTNELGFPTGGKTTSVGVSIQWQDGPLGRREAGGRQAPNGAFVEDVIEAARERIAFFQSFERFRCRENACAITKLEEALHWLEARTSRREAAGTEGTHEGDS